MKSIVKTYKGQGLIALGAIAWGTQGPFAQFLMNQGAGPLFVAVMKLGIGSLILYLIMMIKSPKQLKIDLKGLGITALIGLISQAGFNFLYYNSVQMIGIANAAVVLYTSPIFFLILSVMFFQERLTFKKVLSALLCMLGCGVAVTGGKLDLVGLSLVGLGMALLASLSFAIMSALGKKALVGYESMTIIAYSFMWGCVFLLPGAVSAGAFNLAWNLSLVAGAIGIGLVPAALAYLLYFSGVKAGVSLSQAGVISALEMVSAVIIAWTVFAEPVNVYKFSGVMLIAVSIVMTELNLKKKVLDSCVTEN